MNNIEVKIIKNFNFLSGEIIPYCESIISVKEIVNEYVSVDIKFKFNRYYKILRIFTSDNSEYCSNDIEIIYYLDNYKMRKDKIERLLKNEKESK